MMYARFNNHIGLSIKLLFRDEKSNSANYTKKEIYSLNTGNETSREATIHKKYLQVSKKLFKDQKLASITSVSFIRKMTELAFRKMDKFKEFYTSEPESDNSSR